MGFGCLDGSTLGKSQLAGSKDEDRCVKGPGKSDELTDVLLAGDPVPVQVSEDRVGEDLVESYTSLRIPVEHLHTKPVIGALNSR